MTSVLPPLVRSYRATSGAGIDGLTLRQHEPPTPGPEEVVVAVRATSLSFRELLILRGSYVLPVKPDVIALSDGAGVVAAVGSNVHGFGVGDRVAAAIFPNWQDGPFEQASLPQLGGSLDGVLTEFALVPEKALVRIPEHLSFAEAATLPCVGLTAWNALTGDGEGVQPEQTVLTLGSTGVSLFAIQFAKLLGARVIATTSSPRKEERLRELGADEVINTMRPHQSGTAQFANSPAAAADRVVDVAVMCLTP